MKYSTLHKIDFTLIELLLVIAIITILTALLLPALNQARERGRAVTCLNQLKQIGLASQMYQDEYVGYYPGYFGSSLTTFVADVSGYLGIPKNKISDYAAVGKFFWCPSDRVRADTSNRIYSYAQNLYARYNSPEIFLRRNSQPKKPSEIIYFADCMRDRSGEVGWPMTISGSTFPLNPAGDVGMRIDFRHVGSANVLWIDGHTNAFKMNKLTGKKELDGKPR